MPLLGQSWVGNVTLKAVKLTNWVDIYFNCLPSLLFTNKPGNFLQDIAGKRGSVEITVKNEYRCIYCTAKFIKHTEFKTHLKEHQVSLYLLARACNFLMNKIMLKKFITTIEVALQIWKSKNYEPYGENQKTVERRKRQ